MVGQDSKYKEMAHASQRFGIRPMLGHSSFFVLYKIGKIGISK